MPAYSKDKGSKAPGPRAKQFYGGRRLERRERDPAAVRQAERLDHPNEQEFGAAEYVDEDGRQYRVAYLNRLGGWEPGAPVPPRPKGAKPLRDGRRIKLWLRLKRGEAQRWYKGGESIKLYANRPDLSDREIQVQMADRGAPQRRTGLMWAVPLGNEEEEEDVL